MNNTSLYGHLVLIRSRIHASQTYAIAGRWEEVSRELKTARMSTRQFKVVLSDSIVVAPRAGQRVDLRLAVTLLRNNLDEMTVAALGGNFTKYLPASKDALYRLEILGNGLDEYDFIEFVTDPKRSPAR